MNFLPVPKLLKWPWNLAQAYHCDQKILVTSGCSFTSSTLRLDCASSWPGVVRDRCRFDHVVDWSFPGAGNLYISDSIIKYIETLDDQTKQQIFVIIMWSGLDREEEIVESSQLPFINNFSYQIRLKKQLTKKQQALDSYRHIIRTKQYLETQNIPFAFTFYINLLNPPFLPVRDTTHQFEGFVDSDILNNIRKITWIPKDSKDYLYDFSFYQDYIDQSPDQYHPSYSCVLDWTDTVLLPSMAQHNWITKT